ncbi:MAG: flippase [Actinobacteria bacterium]|nr:flippase [Actinomycetota bacterium]
MEDEGYDAYVGRIARGVGVSSVGQGLSRLLGYATQVAMAWMYGPAQLGFYVLGVTLAQVANILAQFGMDNGVVRYVAHYSAEGDARRVRGTVIQALLITFAFSVVLSVVLFLCAGFLADKVFDKPFLETMFRAFSVSVPFFTVMSMALWATQGFQIVKYQSYVQDVLRPLLNLALIAVFYLLGIKVLGAVAAYIISMAFGAGLALYYLRRIYPGLLNRELKPKFESRALFSASGPMIVTSFTQQINSWLAVLVLGVFAPVREVGIYNVGFRTAALSTLVLFALSGIFSPMVSSLYRRRLSQDLGYLYKDVSRWAFTGALAFFLMTALLGPDIMLVFDAEFVPGWPVIVIIAAAQLFSSSIGPTARVLAMTGHQRIVMFATLGSAAAAVVLNLALVPAFGIYGAAVATAASMVLVNVVTLSSVRKFLGFWPYNARYAKPVIAGLLAAAAVYLVRLGLPGYSGAVALLVFVPLFLTVFGALLVALGLGPSDRQFLASFWSAVLRNVRREKGV